ncbi:hypothetical protein Taro_013585 [Colocasia esculenta]|uniref:Uncharacterized protein n=1 Tax=Colocasia esculenta TaxID=4460 RepID=A0A843UC99_COLES|nr:hypothetical protein [Colocasia esculenta]
MDIRWWGSGDAAAFKCLLALAVMYAVMSYVAHTVIHVRHVRPLGFDAPLDRFSEARTVEHIRYLTVDIDGRQVCAPRGGDVVFNCDGPQEGRPGLDEAARYIKKQLEMLKERAGPRFRNL